MENNAAPERLGRYEIIRELGKGAMGVVYEGRDPSLGRRVAIKTARRDVIERSGLAKEMMERFLREARAAGMLNHPNIITIYDVGEEEGIAYIAMEFLEGKDLNTIITEQRKFDVETVANYGALICEALACAHDQGVFHRDVKPANIFIPSQGVLKVVDFGIARTHDSTLTQDGALIGTPTYMSPEQFMGQKVDARSDLFSVGIILYEMLTGEKPFTGEALTTIMHHILKSTPAPPHELNYLVPEPLSAAVMRALSKRPQERYPNGRAMAAALRESIKDNPDMSLIRGAAPAAEATVVTTAPPAQTDAVEHVPDGTVIEGTTLSTPPTPANAPGATVAGKVPSGFGDYSDPHASKQQAVPGAQDRKGAASSAPVPKQSLSRMLAQHHRMILGIVAVLCLVAGVLIYLLPPASDTTESAGVYVYTTNDRGVANDFITKKERGDDIPAWMEQLAPDTVRLVEHKDVFVRTSHPTTGDVYDEKQLSYGFASVSVPKNVAEVRYDILQGGKSLCNVKVKIDSAQPLPAQDFVILEDVLQP